MEQFGVFTFASVHLCLRAEKIIIAKGLAPKLIPVPRVLTSCCQGLGLCVAPENGEQAADILARSGIPYEKHVVLSADEL